MKGNTYLQSEFQSERMVCVGFLLPFFFFFFSLNISCSLSCSVFSFFHQGTVQQFPLHVGLLLLSRSSVQWWGVCGTNPQGTLVLLTFLILSLEFHFLNPVKLHYFKFCKNLLKFLAPSLASAGAVSES